MTTMIRASSPVVQSQAKNSKSLEQVRAELVAKGKEQSYLSYQEINKALPDGLPTSAFEEVIDELMEANVELVDDDELRLKEKLRMPEGKKKDSEEAKQQDFDDIDDF